MTELTDYIERFERARDELDDKIREANSAVKASKQALAEIAAVWEAMTADVRTMCRERVDAAVGDFLEELGPELKAHMDRSVAHIDRQFKALADAMFVSQNDEADLRDLAVGILNKGPVNKRKPSGRRVANKRKPKYP